MPTDLEDVTDCNLARGTLPRTSSRPGTFTLWLVALAICERLALLKESASRLKRWVLIHQVEVLAALAAEALKHTGLLQ